MIRLIGAARCTVYGATGRFVAFPLPGPRSARPGCDRFAGFCTPPAASPMQIPQHARSGDLVRVRRRTWRIRDIRSYDGCQIVTLAGVGSADFGTERRVIAPFDSIESIERPRRIRTVSAGRWRRACRSLLWSDTPPGGLRCAGAPRIDLLPHQLEPALAIVRGLGSRVLLADEVGLGKTIQAALVLRELTDRAAVDRTLILTPAGLREQWVDELACRFDIASTIVDSREIRRRRAELPVGVNPWSTASCAVASHDFVKRPEILPSVAACHWDLVVVDEAHNVAGDSDRHAACAALVRRAAYVVLLTATPHDGDRRSFASLCDLGAHDDNLLIFRRTRREIGLGAGRRVHLLYVSPSAAERRMHALLARFSRAALSDAHDTDALWLALSVLNKRALSSAKALHDTVERLLAGSAVDRAGDADQLNLFDADEDAQAADRAPELTGLTFGDAKRERKWLETLAASSGDAARHETKARRLARLLDAIREPAVVFTEYRDTLLHLQRHLTMRAAILHGGLTRAERVAALDDFTHGRRRILLATDAAGEGLNLHEASRVVINLELPWNPMRVEQRIGRVDRIGQRRTVHAFHLIARDTGEIRILERLRARIARARMDVGAPDPFDEDDERTVARIVISGESRAQPSEPRHAPLTLTSLKAEGEAEATRLTQARRLFTRCPTSRIQPIEPDDMWLAFARPPASRIALGARAILIFRLAIDDGSGRLVDSTLVPVAVACPFGRRQRLALADFLRRAIPLAAARAQAAVSLWTEDATRIARDFIATRAGRERALSIAAGSATLHFQPNLFDRRADRQRSAEQALAASDADESTRRIAAIEQASDLSAPPPRLLLILAP